jgi:hypothetical protein
VNHMNDKQRPRRTALLMLVAGTVIAAVVAAAVPTYSLDTRHTGALEGGFPRHYTDDSGLKLKLCVDGTGRCLNGVRGDLVAPEGEALYWAAAATLRSRRGPIDVEFALEAAFNDRGRPIVIDRIRIRGHLSRPGRYVLEHPYGRTRFRAINPREQRNVNHTIDRNCSLERNGRCRGRIDNFLRARNRPPGYAGFGERPTRVKGGTVRNNLVLRTRQGKVIGRTSKMAVVGKVRGRVGR